MRHYLILLLPLILNLNIAHAYKVNEVYIESQGNNQFEAKIRAQNNGSLRAFLLYADRFGIKEEDITHLQLANIIPSIINTVFKKETLKPNFYSATADYEFDRLIAADILYKLVDDKYLDKFYEYLILPIMKVGNHIHLWNDKIKWLKLWQLNNANLMDHKILLLTQDSEYEGQFQQSSMNKISYKNFDNIYPELLIKHFCVIIAEYFTNLASGQSYLQVEYREIGSTTTSSVVKKFDMPKNIPQEQVINSIINNFIAERGRNKVILKDDNKALEQNIIRENKLKRIIFNISLENPAQWEKIKAKLDKITDIKKVIIKDQNSHEVIIQIKYSNDSETLTKKLYNNGLSYNTINGKNYLIEINDGI